MKFKKICALIVICSIAFSCTKKDATIDQSDSDLPEVSEPKGEAVKMTTNEQKYAVDSDLFRNPFKNERSKMARTIFKELTAKAENQVFSPMSLEAVLTLLAAGSTGDSLKALQEFLQLGDESAQEHLQYLFGRMQRILADAKRFSGDQPAPELDLGFGIAASDAYPVDEEAVAKIKNEIDLFVKSYDFKEKAEEATKEINGWIAKKTKDKIQKLIPGIEPATAMILINTLYLKSAWTDPFKENLTKPMPFTLADGKEVSVPTMNREGRFSYVKHAAFEAIQMNIVLPDFQFWFLKPTQTPKELVELLSTQNFGELLGETEHPKVRLSLPKFKVRSRIKLMENLMKNGLGILARSPNLEINGFFKEKEDFVVSDAIQGNYFAIDENGVEAASATALMMRAGGMPRDDKPIDLKFDKPFVFMMFQPSTGRVAFLGQVYNPQE